MCINNIKVCSKTATFKWLELLKKKKNRKKLYKYEILARQCFVILYWLKKWQMLLYDM